VGQRLWRPFVVPERPSHEQTHQSLSTAPCQALITERLRHTSERLEWKGTRVAVSERGRVHTATLPLLPLLPLLPSSASPAFIDQYHQ
jgi:hypothetical protein